MFSHPTDETFMAWLAGFVDGEGNIAIYKAKDKRRVDGKVYHYLRPCFGISQKSIEVLNYIKNELKCGKIRVYEPTGVHNYYITGRTNIAWILSELLPYLTVKREAAKKVLKFCEGNGVSSHLKERSK